MYLYLPPTPSTITIIFAILSLSLSLSLCFSIRLSLRTISLEGEAETMGQRSNSYLHLSLIFLFLLFSYSTVATRLLIAKEGEEGVKVDKLVESGPLRTEEMDDTWNKVMGMEHCGNGDEECLKRRMVSEAHLDYIYTQHHKP